MSKTTSPWLRWIFAILSTATLMLDPGESKDAFADDAPVEVHYVLELKQLKLAERAGAKPELLGDSSAFYDSTDVGVVLDGPGEAVLDASRGFRQKDLLLKVPAGKPISGRLFFPPSETEGKLADHAKRELQGRIVKFTVPAGAEPCVPEMYVARLQKHYENLANSGIPGTAWFRHQSRVLNQELKTLRGQATEVTEVDQEVVRWQVESEFDRTFDLVSGGRALSENLQLDRTLPLSKEDKEEVAIDSLTGITVAEMDWKPLIKDAKPKVDPLAVVIPADQHAIFFPTFAALLQATDFADQQGSLLLGMAEPRSESAMSRERYEKQLCLPMSTLARLLGPQVISSVAITGGDLYFRTGTDVAILFEGPNLQGLRTLVESRVLLTAVSNASAKPVTGEVAGVSYRGLRSADRSVCSYVATIGESVVVTNSLAQLQRLAETASGKSESLAKLPEYTFFRERYKRGEAGEVGLMILSDATIRRWCGPKWRIASSRLTRATAVLSEMQASHLDALVKHETKSSKFTSDFPLFTNMTMELNEWGVSSPIYGSLSFQTPIQELEIERVTRQEADFYERWRNGYQQNWRQFFDPIAVQLKLAEDRVTMDLTVLPLIAGSDYRQMINVSEGATLKPGAGDSHAEALLHFVLALNKESETLKRNMNMLQGIAPQVRINPLSWLGDSFSIYLDSSEFWNEAAKAPSAETFLEQNFHRLPVAVNVEVSNGLKLAAFLAGVRAFIEQAAPGMTAWETKEHAGRSYVKISATNEGRQAIGEQRELALYYAPSGTALVISLNEETLKQSLDRQVARAKAKEEGQELSAAEHDWLGGNVGLQASAGMVQLAEALGRESFQRQMQRLAWSNLTILNEWKQRYPDLSPTEVHETHWQRRLVCPGGGEYRWNEQWQTMESTVYGHPGEPKQGPPLSMVLAPYSFGNFGLTFEHGGLQARVELDRAQPATKPAGKPEPVKKGTSEK